MVGEPLEEVESFRKSVQLDPVVGVPLRHIGEDDLVAGHKAADDFDGVDGAAAKLHLRARGVDALGVELEDADLALLLAERGAAFTALIASGDPAREIVATAKAGGSDVIVMGSRGLGKVMGLILGSVTKDVVQTAPCSVWVVR